MSSQPAVSTSIPPLVETFLIQFDKVPPVSMTVSYQDAVAAELPDEGELTLAFKMLDALLLETPFEDWEF